MVLRIHPPRWLRQARILVAFAAARCADSGLFRAHTRAHGQNSGQDNVMPPLHTLESANSGRALQVHDCNFVNAVSQTGKIGFPAIGWEEQPFFANKIRRRNLFSNPASTYITSRVFPEIRPFQEGIRS